MYWLIIKAQVITGEKMKKSSGYSARHKKPARNVHYSIRGRNYRFSYSNAYEQTITKKSLVKYSKPSKVTRFWNINIASDVIKSW